MIGAGHTRVYPAGIPDHDPEQVAGDTLAAGAGGLTMAGKLDRILDKLEELGYRLEMLAGSAQAVVDGHGGARTAHEQAFEHLTYELGKHAAKMSAPVGKAQNAARERPTVS